ncbi:MAG: MerR family transcriptional regulator [Candidatus Sericytochromatia bacterium]
MMKEYSSDMIASQIGVPQQQVENWAEEFHIPYRQKGVSRNFEQEAMDVLKTIKNLKDGNRGFDTIRQKIEVTHPAVWDGPPATGLPSAQALEKLVEDTIERSFEKKWNQLLGQLGDLNELAEKYAQASYSIGQMTEQARTLEEINLRLKAQLQVLPSPDEWQAMQEREVLYKKLLYDLHSRVQKLEYGELVEASFLEAEGLPSIGPEVMAPVNEDVLTASTETTP